MLRTVCRRCGLVLALCVSLGSNAPSTSFENGDALKKHFVIRRLLGRPADSEQDFQIFLTDEDPLPSLTLPFLDYLARFDLTNWTLLEFGSGLSTLYWANRFGRVVSYESADEFMDKITYALQQRLVSKSKVELRKLPSDEASIITELESTLMQANIVVIDHNPSWLSREAVARLVVPRMRKDTLIALDNSEWHVEAQRFLHDVPGMMFVDFVGLRRDSHAVFYVDDLGVATNSGTSMYFWPEGLSALNKQLVADIPLYGHSMTRKQKELSKGRHAEAERLEKLLGNGPLVRKFAQRQENLEHARSSYEAALQFDPQDAQSHHFFGTVLEQQGSTELAKASFETASKIDPQRADTYHKLGVIHAHQGNLDQAKKNLEAAVKTGSGNVETYINLANVNGQQGNLEQAKFQLEEALDIDPQRAEIHYKLATVHVQQWNPEQAKANYEMALMLDPNDANVNYALGVLYEQQGSADQAKARFDTARQIQTINNLRKSSLGR